ncbi:MAG: hypothetical protein ACFFCP_12255 [Promethearchaeota archaeon]
MNVLNRLLGLLLTIISITVLLIVASVPMPVLYAQLFIIGSGYLLTLVLPGLLIDLVFARIGEDIASECGGLRHGGYLIGCVERSLIFLALLITYYDSSLSFAAVLSFLSVIVAGKAIFRYSSKATDDRACADWYILGTLMSITLALALTWGIFRFLLAG